jgi:thiol-disulfide isomerase/thioredoxin
MKIHWLWLLILMTLAACTNQSPMPARAMWNGSVELPGGIFVPLRMSLDFSGEKPAGFFLVGDEKNAIPEIARNENSVMLGFSEYRAEVQLVWNGRQLIGNYRRFRTEGTKSLPLSAAPESPTATDHPSETAESSLPDGNYQVLFQGKENADDKTVAKFWTKDGAHFGTFIAPDGDYGLFVGKASGNKVQYSRFTGWQAMALVLESNAGAWSGIGYAASEPKPLVFTLEPRADLSVERAADKQTTMKDPSAEFAFSGLSLSGEMVRNTDERFKGKALIVDIMGTWCHNCLDEAPVLQRLQEQFGKDGLEVVGLSFEISADPVLAKKNLQLFKDRFGLTYTLLFCGSLDDENVNKQIHSQLKNFFAYPTAIFIDKAHRVRSIHSGFKGPGTGDEFQSQVREFNDLARKLVN